MTKSRCEQILQHLPDYLDGESSAKVCSDIEHHLAGCADCQVVVDTVRKTVQLYRDLPGPSLGEAALRRLYHQLDLDAYLPSQPESSE